MEENEDDNFDWVEEQIDCNKKNIKDCSKSVIEITTPLKQMKDDCKKTISSGLPNKHCCEQCSKQFNCFSRLKRHILSHSSVRPYICKICGKRFKTVNPLHVHVGMHKGIHPYICEYCNKSFSQKSDLKKHVVIHNEHVQFQCNLCDKQFKHLKSLEIHSLTHTGNKNIKCLICGFVAFSKSHLKRHSRVHTKERPYACPICGKCFAEKYNLTTHVRIHDKNPPNIPNKNENHTCLLCGVSYINESSLKKHFISIHEVIIDEIIQIQETEQSQNVHFQDNSQDYEMIIVDDSFIEPSDDYYFPSIYENNDIKITHDQPIEQPQNGYFQENYEDHEITILNSSDIGQNDISYDLKSTSTHNKINKNVQDQKIEQIQNVYIQENSKSHEIIINNSEIKQYDISHDGLQSSLTSHKVNNIIQEREIEQLQNVCFQKNSEDHEMIIFNNIDIEPYGINYEILESSLTDYKIDNIFQDKEIKLHNVCFQENTEDHENIILNNIDFEQYDIQLESSLTDNDIDNIFQEKEIEQIQNVYIQKYSEDHEMIIFNNIGVEQYGTSYDQLESSFTDFKIDNIFQDKEIEQSQKEYFQENSEDHEVIILNNTDFDNYNITNDLLESNLIYNNIDNIFQDKEIKQSQKACFQENSEDYEVIILNNIDIEHNDITNELLESSLTDNDIDNIFQDKEIKQPQNVYFQKSPCE